MKTIILDVPRFLCQYEATNVEEAKTYAKDELTKLVDSSVTRVEDITGKKWPESDAARTSKETSLAIDIVNLFTVSRNITKVTGSNAHISMGKGDIVFNKELCSSLAITDGKDNNGFFSLGQHLTSLALTASNLAAAATPTMAATGTTK